MIKQYFYDKYKIDYSKEKTSESVKVGEAHEIKEVSIIDTDYAAFNFAKIDHTLDLIQNDKKVPTLITNDFDLFLTDFSYDELIVNKFGDYKKYEFDYIHRTFVHYDWIPEDLGTKASSFEVGANCYHPLPIGSFPEWEDQVVFIKYYCYESYEFSGEETGGYLKPVGFVVLDTFDVYGTKGELIEEDIIKDKSYPEDGVKDGYWWVRKEEYTIPKPVIISPENGYVVNNNEGDDLPYFVFELQPRHDGDNNKYHARIRLGFRSDFVNAEIILESKEDQSQWEYYDGSAWQPFPSDGVQANTKVRVKPTVDQFEFGFYYWDVAAWHSFWNCGVSSDHRLLVMITETDEVYFLSIGGRRHYATKLNVIESSNGELGQINLELVNTNV